MSHKLTWVVATSTAARVKRRGCDGWLRGVMDHETDRACSGCVDGRGTSFCAIGVSAAPGPIVGAGLPGLILASGVLLTLTRRRRQLVV
jgi:hypothetical protein